MRVAEKFLVPPKDVPTIPYIPATVQYTWHIVSHFI